jgi:hypothetical protein
MLGIMSPKKKPRDESPRVDARYSAEWIVEGPVPLSDATYSVTWTVEGPLPLSEEDVRRALATLKDAPIVQATKEHPPLEPRRGRSATSDA